MFLVYDCCALFSGFSLTTFEDNFIYGFVFMDRRSFTGIFSNAFCRVVNILRSFCVFAVLGGAMFHTFRH